MYNISRFPPLKVLTFFKVPFKSWNPFNSITRVISVFLTQPDLLRQSTELLFPNTTTNRQYNLSDEGGTTTFLRVYFTKQKAGEWRKQTTKE